MSLLPQPGHRPGNERPGCPCFLKTLTSVFLSENLTAAMSAGTAAMKTEGNWTSVGGVVTFAKLRFFHLTANDGSRGVLTLKGSPLGSLET